MTRRWPQAALPERLREQQAIADAFAGTRVAIADQAGRFELELHQPGLLRPLTGLDEEVVTFLENQPDVHRMREETGATPDEVVRCYILTRDVFRLEDQWAQIDALDNVVPAFTLSQGPSVAPVGLTPNAGLGQGVFAVDRDLGSGYVQQWSASFQRDSAQRRAKPLASLRVNG